MCAIRTCLGQQLDNKLCQTRLDSQNRRFDAFQEQIAALTAQKEMTILNGDRLIRAAEDEVNRFKSELQALTTLYDGLRDLTSRPQDVPSTVDNEVVAKLMLELQEQTKINEELRVEAKSISSRYKTGNLVRNCWTHSVM